ncbi:MAG: succinate--CoA ligase subunit beta [Conexivisphaerales archaeon]
MRLLEYQAKELMSKFGLKVPRGKVVSDVSDAERFARTIGYPVILKAQLPIGGRGKAGLILKVKDDTELQANFRRLQETRVSGYTVREVLVEPFLAHDRELYISLFENRGDRCFTLIASSSGGVDVEEVKDKYVANFGLGGPSEEVYSAAASYLKLTSKERERFISTAKKLYTVFDSSEAELVEVNPLAYVSNSSSNDFMPLDAKIILDDNALFRRPELKPYLPSDISVEEAEKYGFNFVPLDGDVAVVGNGAGLVLATLDMVSSRGLTPACFLDLGGGATPERVLAALELLSKALPNMKALFINVFGGITNSVSVAEGFLEARRRGLLSKPFFIRLSGAGEDEARELLRQNGIDSHIDVEEALDSLSRWGGK